MIELDKKLFSLLNGDLGIFADKFFLMLTNHLSFVVLILVAGFIVYRKFGWRTALLTVLMAGVAIGTCDQICNTFKNLIPKNRPIYTADLQLSTYIVKSYIPTTLHGTISGHAATSMSIALLTSLIIRKRVYTIIAITYSLLVCYSRIYLSMHFPMDLIIGLVIGVGVAILYYKLFLKIVKKYKSLFKNTSREY